MKTCNYCGYEKSLSNFQKQQGTIDNLRGHCRECAALKMRNYRKTGSTTTREMADRTTNQLEVLEREIIIELKKRVVR